MIINYASSRSWPMHMRRTGERSSQLSGRRHAMPNQIHQRWTSEWARSAGELGPCTSRRPTGRPTNRPSELLAAPPSARWRHAAEYSRSPPRRPPALIEGTPRGGSNQGHRGVAVSRNGGDLIETKRNETKRKATPWFEPFREWFVSHATATPPPRSEATPVPPGWRPARCSAHLNCRAIP